MVYQKPMNNLRFPSHPHKKSNIPNTHIHSLLSSTYMYFVCIMAVSTLMYVHIIQVKKSTKTNMAGHISNSSLSKDIINQL